MISDYAINTVSMITRRMEQHPVEIVSFVDYLCERDIKTVVEIGVRFGGTASLWCQLGFKQVIGIDWGGKDSLGEKDTLELAVQMEYEYEAYNFVYGDSQNIETVHNVNSIIGDNKVDFLFIDGNHSYEGVSRDFKLYSPLVSDSGIIAFHDIVDSKLIRDAGHGVYKFWRELKEKSKRGNKGRTIEFCINGEWGGIGVLELA